MTNISDNSTPDQIPDQDVPLKRCKKCGQEFPATIEYFSPNRHHRDGFISKCKQCNRKLTPEQYAVWKAKRERPKLPQVCVYLITYEEIPGLYKIGSTWGLSDRLITFKTSMPFDPVIVHLIPCPNPPALERELHQHFSDKHFRREWYSLTPEDVEYIAALAASRG